MTVQTKGRIRHVALSVKDPWETAEFYKQAVGLQEVAADGHARGTALRRHCIEAAHQHVADELQHALANIAFVGRLAFTGGDREPELSAYAAYALLTLLIVLVVFLLIQT